MTLLIALMRLGRSTLPISLYKVRFSRNDR